MQTKLTLSSYKNWKMFKAILYLKHQRVLEKSELDAK
jgi:hypothetical protein